ncbi:MAG: monovalent cation/H(+) antiporter subunit G [Nitriliruptoraceae bacterium]|nr:monovalent cation/H(+) antiporter subunit G [Nitriliruptoraceae bacterium]
MSALGIVSIVLVFVGLFFLVVSTIALLIMPDLYTRAHAVAKSETLALLMIFGGLFFHPDLDIHAAFRLVFVLVFSLIANPAAVHALVRAARRSGAEPWTIVDQEGADAELGAVDGRRPS